MDNSMSPADFAAMSNGEFGGNGFIYMLFLFLIIFGWGGFNGNQSATNESVQQGFDMQNTLANQRELLAATNQTFHDTMGVIQNTYGELQRDIAGLAVGQANLLAQQNECCANISAGIAQNRYDAAMNTAQIVQAIQQDGSATRAMIQQDKIEGLQQQVNQLQLQQAVAGVVRYPDSWAYNAGTSPFCGCGCNC